MRPGRRRMSTRTGIWNSGAATNSRSSTAPLASPKCRRPRRYWKRLTKAPTLGSGCSPLLLFQRAVGDDGIALNAAEPAEREIVPLPRDGDGAVRTATAFVGLALGDGLGVEEVGFR